MIPNHQPLSEEELAYSLRNTFKDEIKILKGLLNSPEVSLPKSELKREINHNVKIVHLLSRLIPQQVINLKFSDPSYLAQGSCPHCRALVKNIDSNCSVCGQKLLWSE